MPFYQSEKHLPRGEMWLGRGLFGELGWKDDLAARVRLCRELAMDIIFFSVDSPSPHHHSFDYNYFSLGYVLRLIAQKRALPVGIIIDGPFEQLAHQLGLQELLHRWRDEKDRLLPGAAAQVAQVFSACLEAGPDAIVIADDIAYHQSTYVNPTDLEASLFGFYRDWVAQAHRLGIPV
ncbi:MAG: hypothetical protein Q8O05_01380, partial [Chloroflexota bacterium]|nr:hypothetical protein [Chloroflexota bacterium]